MRSLCAHDEHPDIAFTRLANRLAQTLGKAQIKPVVGRIRQYDIPDLPFALKTYAFHWKTSCCRSNTQGVTDALQGSDTQDDDAFNGMMGSSKCEGWSASR